MPYVRMDAKPQGDHWEAHNAHAELRKEKREYKFAICVFKRKGMGSRAFKLTINLQQANAQLFLPRIAIKSVEQLPNPWAETKQETLKTRQVNTPDLCSQLPEGSLRRHFSSSAHNTRQNPRPNPNLSCTLRNEDSPLLAPSSHSLPTVASRIRIWPLAVQYLMDLDSKGALAEDKSY